MKLREDNVRVTQKYY